MNSKTILYLCCASTMLSLCGCYNEAQDYKGLMEREATVKGTVYKLNCTQHGQFWYEFTWNGKRHIGRNEYYAKILCQDLRAGDSILVHVDPTNPSVHTIAAPVDVFKHERGFYLPDWAWPILAPLVGVGFTIWKAMRSSKKAPMAKES